MAGLIPFQSEKSRAEKQILSFLACIYVELRWCTVYMFGFKHGSAFGNTGPRLTRILQIILWLVGFCLRLFVFLFFKFELNNLKKAPISLKLPLICLNILSIGLNLPQNFSNLSKCLTNSSRILILVLGARVSLPHNASKFLKMSLNVHEGCIIMTFFVLNHGIIFF